MIDPLSRTWLARWLSDFSARLWTVYIVAWIDTFISHPLLA